MNIFALIGRQTLKITDEAGRVFIFLGLSLSHIFRGPFYLRETLRQMEKIGVDSLPIVLLTSFFTGGVLALQSYDGLGNGAIAAENLGSVVALSMFRELGPVLGSLMVAGRVGAAIAAEIGTMRVSEQIDALITLAANPIKFLVVPRMVACISMVPLLIILADIMGIFGGYVVATKSLGLPAHSYIDKSFASVEFYDIFLGLVKAVVFGLIIALMGCYQGYNSKGGAEGVGRATTIAVVNASVLILIFDYLITALMF